MHALGVWPAVCLAALAAQSSHVTAGVRGAQTIRPDDGCLASLTALLLCFAPLVLDRASSLRQGSYRPRRSATRRRLAHEWRARIAICRGFAGANGY
jgi:hypothetical protein